MRKKSLIFLIIGIISTLGGAGLIVYPFIKPIEEKPDLVFPTVPTVAQESKKAYSILTGVEIADESLNSSPVFCVQVPNGTDGARPQAGLDDAEIVFEAIAEAGITRFATIFQNPSSTIIGPVRSLRTYYLQWDIPFDCTIVHAGGAQDALQAVTAYKHQSENYTYMYRGTYSRRLWNNLFTTASKLNQIAINQNHPTSNPQGFARMTPEESERSRIDTLVSDHLDITTSTDKNTSELVPITSRAAFRFGNSSVFNIVYNYDIATNTYFRSFASGAAHEIYSCPTDDQFKKNPEDICTLKQLSPSVVIAMVVQEQKAPGGYYEAITTTGTGDAYIFQNGTTIKATWSKPTYNDQIRFLDADGNDIKLAPGQTWISAVPKYGSVEY